MVGTQDGATKFIKCLREPHVKVLSVDDTFKVFFKMCIIVLTCKITHDYSCTGFVSAADLSSSYNQLGFLKFSWRVFHRILIDMH